MSAFPCLALLFCFVGFGVHVASQSIPSPTPNPECSGLHRIAKRLETGIKTYTKETTLCKVNGACTGLMCNGTHKQGDFYMKMELKHCKTPPEIHLDLVYTRYNIKVHRELKEGKPIKITSQKTPLGTVPVELKLTLRKDRNRITTGLEVEVCTPIACKILATLLPPTTFCLNMKTCPGYNSTGDIPCHINPTGNPRSTMTTRASSGPINTSAKHSSTTSRPRIHSPTVSHTTLLTKVVPTENSEHSSTTLRFSTNKPTQNSEPTKLVSTRGIIHTMSSSIKPSTHNTTGPISTSAKHSSTTSRPRIHSPTVSHTTLLTKVVPTENSEHSSTTLRFSTNKPTQNSEPTKLVSTRGIIHTMSSSIKPSTHNTTGPISTSAKHSSTTSRPRIHSPTVSHTTLLTKVVPTENSEHSSTTLRFSTNKPTQNSEPTKLVSTRGIIHTMSSSIKPSTHNTTGPISTSAKHSSTTSRPRIHSPTVSHTTLLTKVVPTENSEHSSTTLRFSTNKPTQNSEPTKLVSTRGIIHTMSSSIKPSTHNTTGPISTSAKHSSTTSRPRIHSPTVSHTTLLTKVVPTENSEHSSTTLRFSTNKPTQNSEPTKLVSTRGIIHTMSSSIKPSTHNTTGTTVQPGDTHALKRKSGHHYITTGVAVGIGFACLVGVLIIVGAAFYWKKFYRRSRLRAAYYNDISMNDHDPLYEDFGPEVA